MRPLEVYFEQVWVVNLKSRPERLSRFWSEIEKSGWPFRRPQVFYGIEGDKVGVPVFWRTGGGSYGCMRSHLNLLERKRKGGTHSLVRFYVVSGKHQANRTKLWVDKIPRNDTQALDDLPPSFIHITSIGWVVMYISI